MHKVMAAPLDIGFLHIRDIRVRGAVNGGLLVEVFAEDGVNAEAAADALAARLREVLVFMGRLRKTAGIRVWGLVSETPVEKVRAALARTGGCDPRDVRVAEL